MTAGRSSAPTIHVHDRVHVVRDDLFKYGSKARFLDKFFRELPNDIDEVVYGSSPRWGFAQISLAYLGAQHGRLVRIYLAKAHGFTEYTQKAIHLGAHIVEVPGGYLTVCEARAREYAEDSHNAMLLPCGLAVPGVEEEIARIARMLRVEPDEVWTVAGSGTLTRGLQLAWPEADFYAVQTGKALTPESVGKAKIIKSPLPFNKPTKKLPPFPSVPQYDAKAWEFIPKDGKKLRLFWNVGA